MSCNRPIYLKSKDMFVDCGKCFGCKKKKASEWSLRIQFEMSTNPRCLYLTFTYAPEFMLSSSITPRDFQLFMKKLRKRLPDRKVLYYTVGEYGEDSFRKHYHSIMFGVSYDDVSVINDCWSMGFVDIAPVEVGSVNYVVGYVQKKLTLSDDYYINLGFAATFSIMSRGIGLDYVLKNYDYLRNRKYVLLGNVKYPIPRYFRNILGLTIDDGEYDEYIKKITSEKNVEYERMYSHLELNDEDFYARKSLVNEMASVSSQLGYKYLKYLYTINSAKENNLKVKNSLYRRNKL